MKYLIAVLVSLSLIIAFTPTLADAHQSGCHRWHSCPSDSGSYVCGDLGYDTYCPKSIPPKTETPKYVPPKEPLKPSPKISDYSEPTFSTKVQFNGKNFIPSKISATNIIFLENTSETSVQIKIKTYHTIGSQAFPQEESITIMPGKIKSLQMPIPITDPVLSQITFISQSGSLLIVDNQGKNDYNKYLAKTTLVSDQINASSIPSWIKNNAKWWAAGQIDDATFVSGMKYLINEGTLKVPQTAQGSGTGNKIPTWIKNNAGWWADGSIDDTSFVQGIQFLIQEGTLKVSDANNTKCSGKMLCITDKVTKVVDGDTIYTTNYQIRLSLSNTPERNESGFSEATAFTASLCPVGSTITVDQDDLQPYDVYDRLLGKVYCGNKVLNSELLYANHGTILKQYCSTSEFSGESWAQSYGCKSVSIEPPKTTDIPKVIPKETPKDIPKENCDSSYPDVCIPPYPPDLNCGDIPYKNFRVVGSDPHRFDGDKDGIGCES